VELETALPSANADGALFLGLTALLAGIVSQYGSNI